MYTCLVQAEAQVQIQLLAIDKLNKDLKQSKTQLTLITDKSSGGTDVVSTIELSITSASNTWQTMFKDARQEHDNQLRLH